MLLFCKKFLLFDEKIVFLSLPQKIQANLHKLSAQKYALCTHVKTMLPKKSFEDCAKGTNKKSDLPSSLLKEYDGEGKEIKKLLTEACVWCKIE